MLACQLLPVWNVHYVAVTTFKLKPVGKKKNTLDHTVEYIHTDLQSTFCTNLISPKNSFQCHRWK